MSRDKELGEVVSAIISFVNNHYSFLVELLCVLTVMFARKRFAKKWLLLLMSYDSKMQNWRKGSRCSPPRFWVRSYRNLKWWNDFIMETWFLKKGKKLECHNVHFTFCVNSYEHTVRVKHRINSQLSPL